MRNRERMVTTVCIKGDSHLPATHQWPSLYCPDQTGNVRCCVSENSICVWKKRGVWVHMFVYEPGNWWGYGLVHLHWFGRASCVGKMPAVSSSSNINCFLEDCGDRLNIRRKLMYFLHLEWTKPREVGTAAVVG